MSAQVLKECMKNLVLNGAMRIDQNKEGGIYSSDPTSETYTLDQWRFCGGTSGVGRFTIQRMPIDFNGFDYCLQAATTVQQTSLSPTDNCHIEYPIEGSRMKHLSFGTGNAKTITLSFWVVATQAGEYSFAIMNGINTRSYVTSFTITTASAWQYITITIPGDTSGVWSGAECVFGMKLLWSLGVGASATISTTETWQGSAYWNKTGTTQLIEGYNSLYITGVQLEVGSAATDYDHRSLTEELQDLQRYYYKTYAHGIAVGSASTAGAQTYYANIGSHLRYPVVMEASPNLTMYGAGTSLNATETGVYLYNTGTALTYTHVVANARLGGS